MFHRRVWRYKWLVLAPFEQHLGAVRYAEIIGPHEKRYQFGPVDGLWNLPFCVSIAYAKSAWHGDVKPCTKAKATHLVIRPHFRKEYHRPLSNSAMRERSQMYRIRDRMSGSVKHFTGETESDQMLSQWVGIELVLSAVDVEQSPDQAYAKWQNEVSPLRCEHG